MSNYLRVLFRPAWQAQPEQLSSPGMTGRSSIR